MSAKREWVRKTPIGMKEPQKVTRLCADDDNGAYPVEAHRTLQMPDGKGCKWVPRPRVVSQDKPFFRRVNYPYLRPDEKAMGTRWGGTIEYPWLSIVPNKSRT